jgi:RimJ/RimL family protein N-acetyltransferase
VAVIGAVFYITIGSAPSRASFVSGLVVVAWVEAALFVLAAALTFLLPRRAEGDLPTGSATAHNPPVTQTPDFATKPTLAGDKVILRPFRERDLPAMSEAMGDPEGRVLTGSVHDEAQARAPFTPEEEELACDWLLTRNDQADRLDLAVTDKSTGECVGEVVLNEWDPGNESCNFRIFIGPKGRDRGLGTEATRLIVGYGFGRLRLHRISLEVYAFNPRARRAYEKAGFRPEGVLRESLRYNGAWIDATIMSILAPEWSASPSSRG